MEGDKQNNTKGKQGSRHVKGETVEETCSEEESYENNGDAGDEEVASPVMQDIYNEIRALRSDLKSEMSEFRRSFRDDMKKELNEFNQKLQEATGELRATIARVEVAEQCISDIEEWDTAEKEALAQALIKRPCRLS